MANTKLLILEVCKAKGVTLTELASRIPSKTEGKSIALSTLSEKIKDGNFTLNSLEAIATALGVGVRDLIAPAEACAEASPKTVEVETTCPHCGEPLTITIKG